MDEVHRFAHLFRGRSNAYGADHGECIRQPVTSRTFERHLSGVEPIGIYPLTDDLTVAWGCSDIDVEDATMAWNLAKVLDALGMFPWVERSRSKGYHVWVFADDWVPAQVLRDAFLAAHQIADVPAREVNPKQTKLNGAGFGNYVRLPYPARGATERQVMIHQDGTPMPFHDFMAEVPHHALTSLETLEKAAALYAPPPPKPPIRIAPWATTEGTLEAITSKLNGLAYTIWRDGPLDGSDRSTTLAKLAHKCRESGLTAPEALLIVTDLDSRLGKFCARPDGAERLMELVARAY